MIQDHWHDSNDTAQTDNNNRNSKRKHDLRARRLPRMAMLLACALLLSALCSCTGIWDSTYGGGLSSSQSDGGGDETPGFESPGNATDSASGIDTGDRNPTPHVQKDPSLGRVTYSGSAGDKAYSTLAEAYDTVDECVVEITTETVVNGGWLGNYVSDGAGSGVIISSDGYIVTNNHVIDGADTVTVRLTDGSSFEAAVIGADAATDIAVLWVDTQGKSLSRATLGCSADLVVGEPVFAIGNPLGSLGGTLTNGIISATERQVTIDGSLMTLLQTNAAVNPGNSGGGLFNMAGQLIGVVNAKYSQDDVEGLGFAIPVDIAYDIIGQLIEFGYVRGKVDSGLTLYDATSTMTAWKNFGSTRTGVYILESEFTEELQFGDYLVDIDGVAITQSADAEAQLASYAVGDTVTLTVIRLVEVEQNGRLVTEEQTLSVTLTLQEYVPVNANVRFSTK